MEPATFCWAECIRYFLFSSTCRMRTSLVHNNNNNNNTSRSVHRRCLCLFLPGEYRSRWRGSLLCPPWAWLSSPFAVSRSEPRPPPSSHQTRTGRTEQETPVSTEAPTLLVSAPTGILQDLPEGSAGRWPCG